VSLLNKVLTLVSNTIQSVVLLKCMAIKQTMSLGVQETSSSFQITAAFPPTSSSHCQSEESVEVKKMMTQEV
jgi:hypothetical protein